jgi:hypothetical protein
VEFRQNVAEQPLPVLPVVPSAPVPKVASVPAQHPVVTPRPPAGSKASPRPAARSSAEPRDDPPAQATSKRQRSRNEIDKQVGKVVGPIMESFVAKLGH